MAKKGKKNKRKTIKTIGKSLLAIGLLTCFVAVMFLSTFVVDAYGFDITNYKMDSSSVVYGVDKNGNPIEYEQLHGDTRRVWVDLENIPDYVQNAAIAIEDERFYSHRGIDIKRTLGAIFGFITGTSDYGGSTITQQLVKNVTGDWDNSPTRKIREIFRALVLETKMSKQEILEYYLNIVYFGNGSNGVQMAAYTYFDKDVSELTVAEAASIVGITQSPRNLDPFVYPENNKNRQMLVLGKMKELGYLTEEEYNEAASQPLEFKQTSIAQKNGVNTWFSEALVEEVTNDLARKENIPVEQATRLVYSGGLKIYSTMEVDVQNAMHKTFEDSGNTALFPKLSGEVQPQAAMVIISPEDGAIRGMIGGVGPKTESLILNRAKDTYRQPGSSIKPLAVYGPAVEENLLSPGSIIIDEPFSYNGWNPQNWYKGYEGPVTMRRAVERSMNIPAIKTLNMVGVDTSYDYLVNKMHFSQISAKDDKYLAPLSLGGLTKGVSVEEMAAARVC
ncbi:MAG: transglycosylase domain-containing protein [Clostridia bacterium]|nr:transglycosylase domain-containing protein [Clostridia bacterium]